MRADVIIVGGGLAGSAAAWELTRRGRDVVVLEAFEPGHRRGSSHGSARIFRRAYPDPLYVTLTGVARRLWSELEDEAGEELIRVTGAVDFGPPRPKAQADSTQPDPEKMHEILTAQHVPAELLTATEAAERWPGITFDPRHPVLFHPEGGVIDADRAVAAMQRLATQRGAGIRHNTPVTGIDADGTVRTADAEFTAPVVVVAAGAWLEPLLGHLVRLPRLVVTQVDVFHFAPAEAGTLASGPTWICTEAPSMYGLPSGADSPGAVKVGAHYLRTVTTGDDRDNVVNPAVRDQVLQFVRAKINGLSSTPIAELTCLYTSTTSEDFVLDRRGPFVVASVCSGHGAKFAPLAGRIIADLAEGRAATHRRFSLAELPATFPTQSASLLAGVRHRP
ncbi:MAG: FAD-dependent oxidoreductase [Streptosporangiaceae bacterium]|nr:FAD-dependent oxidoreductase [Streptosporangiaceae bacterium]